VRIAFVVHRYGADILGGSETHCRVLAEGLARHHEVEVLTTTASDYVTWAEGYEPGAEALNGVTVRRFPVAALRNVTRFKEACSGVFERPHTRGDELTWIDENGPRTPALVEHLRRHGDAYDIVVAFSFRYWTAYNACLALPEKTVPFPTAEADPAIQIRALQERLLAAPTIFFNTPEERRMLERACGTPLPDGETIGFPIDPPGPADAAAFRATFSIDRPFALYLGRIDSNKGCRELFEHFLGYAARKGAALDLVLGGKPAMDVPDHPAIHRAGFLTDQQKEDALAAATCLVMPSRYESLSIVLLEAWRRTIPVLVNGACDVLREQTRRSGGGLYYESFADFADGMEYLAASPALRQALGASGRQFVAREYSWSNVRDKMERTFARVAGGRPPAAAVL
jgi:glycosyltransferase involved in cell wall biosynthesis